MKQKTLLPCKVLAIPTQESTPLHQHIYFVSERKIQEGDWMTDGNAVYKAPPADAYIGLFKIEATTDDSLGLRLIPSLFIHGYIKEKGNINYVNIDALKTHSKHAIVYP